MKPRALFIITGDPRTSAKPAEAIRIAAGVGTWKKADVDLYLYGEGRHILDEAGADFIDEEHLTRYLPMLQESGGRVFVTELVRRRVL